MPPKNKPSDSADDRNEENVVSRWQNIDGLQKNILIEVFMKGCLVKIKGIISTLFKRLNKTAKRD